MDSLRFDSRGLIPVIAQEERGSEIMMFAFANLEAIERTLETGKAHYYSRSRSKLWLKGGESGHFQMVKGIYTDCDQDVLIYKIEQIGSIACHTGRASCFHYKLGSDGRFRKILEESYRSKHFLNELQSTIRGRRSSADSKSYVATLNSKGQDFILKKVIEEAGEFLMASKDFRNDSGAPLIKEAADLLFHMMVSLDYHGLDIQQVVDELRLRRGMSGIEEKRSRGR